MKFDISFELYKVFYLVATTGSFSAAAKELFVSQSAVSQSIKTLEQELGQSLFIRTTKKVSLTKTGQLLFSHVEPACLLLSQGQSIVQEENMLEGGVLRIGASDTICRYFLLPYVKQFHQSYPKVSIKITNQTSSRCVDLLDAGDVDIIITNTPNSKLSSKFDQKKLKSFCDCFIAGSAYEDLKGQSLTLAQLSSHSLLMLDKTSTTSEFLNHLFLQKNLTLTPAVELGSNDLLIDLAKINLGIAVVPDYLFDNGLPEGLFEIKLGKSLPKRSIVAATLPASLTSPVVRAFLDFLPEIP